MFASLAVHGAAAQMLVWGQCDGTVMRQVQGLCVISRRFRSISGATGMVAHFLGFSRKTLLVRMTKGRG